jgi:sulfhydrogenase subunit alpha
MSRTRTVKVDYMTRIEGEAAIMVKLAGDRVSEVQFKVFEPPRFFEAFLRGRSYREVPDIVARICGICPVAYQMSSVHALEHILDIALDPQVRELRRLFYCGEWIESHGLHIYMLHAPDYLGYPDALAIARDHPERVKQGLQFKKTGNDLVALLGGREIHPVSACVGGFYKVPSRAELLAFRPRLEAAYELGVETLKWVRAFEFPEYEPDYEFVAVRGDNEYPFNEGRIVSSRGLDIPVREYEHYFAEEHVGHSHALQSRIHHRGAYHTGPLARLNLCFDLLPENVRKLAEESGVAPPCRNPFKSIVVRAVEAIWACQEAMRIIDQYKQPAEPFVVAEPQEGFGCAATEAPRGLLYHSYQLDSKGCVLKAKITPPTSQNQKRMEEDLREVATLFAELPDDELTHKCEQLVRNYDPCISCATHALRVRVVRG